MRETRRDFLRMPPCFSACLALPEEILAGQNPPTPPPKPEPGYTPNPAEIHSNRAETAAARRARPQESEKEFREDVERLYQLTSSLPDDLQKTPTTEVFSIRIVKKTEEIEKPAKRRKSQAKSG